MTIPTSSPMHHGSRIFARLDHPYYVCAPKFRQTSGGIRAMHYLCHVLNLLGHEAYVNTEVMHPDLRTPRLTNDIVQAHADANRSAIAIYPEIVSGNPFGTRCVARYLLAEPGRIEGNTIDLQPSDLVFAFGPTLVPAGWQADLLRMPLVDTRIFNSDGVDDARRSGTAVFINRHLVRGGSLHPVTADSIEISNRVPERSAHELAALFRQVECVYLYEWSTAAFEALLCGCPVVCILNDASMPKAERWVMDGKGIAWGSTKRRSPTRRPPFTKRATRTCRKRRRSGGSCRRSSTRPRPARTNWTRRPLRPAPPAARRPRRASASRS